ICRLRSLPTKTNRGNHESDCQSRQRLGNCYLPTYASGAERIEIQFITPCTTILGKLKCIWSWGRQLYLTWSARVLAVNQILHPARPNFLSHDFHVRKCPESIEFPEDRSAPRLLEMRLAIHSDLHLRLVIEHFDVARYNLIGFYLNFPFWSKHCVLVGSFQYR